MQTLPPTSFGLVAACVILLALNLMAALGVGASSRIIGFQVPYVAWSKSTWIGGHRAALWAVVPCSAVALVLVLSSDGELVGLGWFLWGVGLAGGALAALLRARRILNDETN